MRRFCFGTLRNGIGHHANARHYGLGIWQSGVDNSGHSAASKPGDPCLMNLFFLAQVSASSGSHPLEDAVASIERFKLVATHPLAFVAYALLLGVLVYSIHARTALKSLKLAIRAGKDLTPARLK